MESAVLIEPYGCAKHAVDRAEITPEDIVVLSGAGTLGLGMTTCARLCHPKQLIVLDMKEDRLAEFLERYHSGESNAATSRELECVFSIRGIEVRQMVNRLRRKSIPIASSGNGYYYAATEQEVRATIAHLTRRISGIAAAIAGLNHSLEQFDTAQTRLPLEGGDAVE